VWTELITGLGRGRSRALIQLVPYVAIIVWGTALVFAHSTGRIETGRGLVLLAFPIVAVGAAIRPAWVVLFLVAAPVGQIQIVSTGVLMLLMLLTLGGQLVTRGSVSVGRRSGFLGFIVLVATAFFFRADISGRDALIARGIWNLLAFYLLLGLVTYNATRIGDLRGKDLVNALLFGLTLSVILEHTVLSDESGILGSGAAPLGRAAAYLAAVGFAVCFARLITRTEDGGRYHPAVHLGLAAVFMLAMVPGLLRGAWVSALVAVVVISLWTGKRSYWLLILFALTALLIVPVTRERIAPNEQQAAGGGYTTGRFDLWSQLWVNEIVPALPLGNGFGHMFTLSSEDIFGAGDTSFDPSGTGFVYAHNDLIYWMVELGLVGLLGMVLFWSQLLSTSRSLSRSESVNSVHVQILSGVLITGLVTQLVASTIFFTGLAVPFFAAAGFVFGAREVSVIRHAQSGIS